MPAMSTANGQPNTEPPIPPSPVESATPAPAYTPPAEPAEPEGLTPQQRAYVVGGAIFALLILAGLIAGAVWLINNPDRAATVRDVFIIAMALEMILIGAALTVLMVQLAVLTNLLKNEIKPILEATQETVNTVRGTTIFVSENLTEPIMKLNSYVAGLAKMVETLSALGNIFRR
jgi:predicted tellurium resistance membrane protein TerC